MRRAWFQRRGCLGLLLVAGAAHAQSEVEAAPASNQPSVAHEKPAEIEAFEQSPEATPTSSPATVTPIEAIQATPEAPSIQLHGNVRADTGLDTRFDSPRNVPLAENVFEARLKTTVGVDVKINSNLRLVLEGRAQVRFVTQRSFDRAKAFFEPTLGDAFFDLYSEKVDVRIGNQRIAIGANTALAPADAFNPRDLRESFVQGELEDTILPSFAIRAQGELGRLSWLAAYAPFFQGHRYFVFGQDEALAQPGLAPSFDNRRIDPSIEDAIQERVLETRRPVPFAGDFVVRLVSQGRFKVGASWVWMNEKLPRVTVDPEVAALSRAQAAGKTLDPAAALSVLNRFQAGETLVTGVYARQHLFSLEGSTLIGPGQLDADLTFSPRQTFVDPAFTPIDKASLTWVLGYSQATESPVYYAVNYMGIAIPGVRANEQLLLIEPATAVGAARTAFFHLIVGTIAAPVWKRRFELQLRAAVEPIQRSFTLGPRVTFQAIDRLKIWLAGEIYSGPSYSPFGYYSRNSKVVLGVRYDIF